MAIEENNKLLTSYWVTFVAMEMVGIFGLVVLIVGNADDMIQYYAPSQFITIAANAYFLWKCKKKGLF